MEVGHAEAQQGLSQHEAERRFREEGPNELPRAERRNAFQIAFGLLREPMIALLVAAGAVYLFIGDPAEAALLLASIGFIVAIDLYQERRTERALEALQGLSSPRALVVRDGVRRRVPGREVVRGDLLVVSEGDRVAADATLLDCNNLSVDESLLTGESVPVRKSAAPRPGERPHPGGDDLPYVYSTTLATSGQGLALVTATGTATEMGRIGSALQELQPERTRLQRETGRVVRLLAVIAVSLSVVVAVGTALTGGSIVDGVLGGIAVAMALIPEEFPVVLTVFLALGAWRIARSNVLTRRIPAVEALGAVTVLCVDKTGTLTENRMTVARLAAGEAEVEIGGDSLPHAFRSLARLAALASQVDPFDPMERAIRDLDEHQPDEEAPGATEPAALVRSYPLLNSLLVMAQAWRLPGESGLLLAAKGAPEDVLALCGLSPEEHEAFARRVETMAAAGLRVLGVADARVDDERALPDDIRATGWTFAGLVGLADPVRASVPPAVEESYRAGIRVVMLTGDYPVTARSIAAQAGLRPLDPVLTGAEIETLEEAALERHVRESAIFARVRPEQKLRLVQALKADGEIVAMTGDGVNDAPALKAADVGIAMGQRGTDVAREAAAIVLADDDFASIVRAVRLGRRIFDNLRRAMAFLLAVHVPIAGLAVIPIVAGWPLILFPAHIVFLELVIDPACSIAFESEPEEADVMTRPPRPADEPLFDRRTILVALAQGLGVLLVTAAVLAIGIQRGLPDDETRTLVFTTLVISNLGLILANRTGGRSVFAALRGRNTALWLVVGGAALLLAVVLVVPPARTLFHFAPASRDDIISAAAAVALVLVWLDLTRVVGRRSAKPAAGT